MSPKPFLRKCPVCRKQNIETDIATGHFRCLDCGCGFHRFDKR